MSAPKYCDDPDNCGYADCPTAFCDRNASTHSLQRVVLPPCPNCKERVSECACMRNKCECGKPVGNITFTLCDECWEIKVSAPLRERPNGGTQPRGSDAADRT